MHYSILIQSVAQLPLFSYLSERKSSSLGPLLKRHQSRSFVRKAHTGTLGGYDLRILVFMPNRRWKFFLFAAWEVFPLGRSHTWNNLLNN